jgi:hypothetical protein
LNAAGGGPEVLQRLKPNTRRGWTLYALGLLAFVALDVLALMGEELASKLLVSLSGMVIGGAAGYVASRPFRRFAGVWRTLGVFVGLALTFAIVFAGSALAGIPAYPTAEGGNVGILIYGLAFGFGVSVPRGLGVSGPFYGSRRDPRGSELKTSILVLGTVAGLFAVLFVSFVLLEYVVAPLIRHFAG